MNTDIIRLKKYILLIRDLPAGTDRAALAVECEQICYKYLDPMLGDLRTRIAFASYFRQPGLIIAPLGRLNAMRFKMALMVAVGPFFAFERLCCYTLHRTRNNHNIGAIMTDLDLIMLPISIGIPFFVT
jgi:hypothetical protein